MSLQIHPQSGLFWKDYYKAIGKPEMSRLIDKNYYEKHKEQKLAKMKEYYQKNKERIKLAVKLRYAQKKVKMQLNVPESV